MKTFRLDECANAKKIRSDCATEGLARVIRFPHGLVNKSVKDPDVLAAVLSDDVTFVTTDGRILTEHADSIPDRHPGIVIIKHIGKSTIRIKDIQYIIHNFKTRIENWHLISLVNSVLEVSEEYVVAFRIVGGQIARETYLPFDLPNWCERFLAEISQNELEPE